MPVKKNILGVPPSKANIRVTGPLVSAQEVASKFLKLGLTAADLTPIDWRKKVTLTPIKNQETCGDCWAVSSTCALIDRFIISKNLTNLDIDPAIVAQCVNAGPSMTLNDGCEGGQPILAGQFFESYGVPAVSGNCIALTKVCDDNSCNLPTCDTLLGNCKDLPVYKAVKDSTKNLAAQIGNNIDTNATIANIKQELMNGPVVAAFLVMLDFEVNSPGINFPWPTTNGIYINGAYNDALDNLGINPQILANLGNPKGDMWANTVKGGHAVEIVGWDIGDAGPKYGKVGYWIVKNSWGDKWNENGYFRIAMSDQGLNTAIGFDVPINSGGGFFGGCISFEPDLTSGDPTPNPPPPGPNPPKPNPGPVPGGKSNGSTSIKWVWIGIAIGVGVLLLGLTAWYFYSRGLHATSYYEPAYPSNMSNNNNSRANTSSQPPVTASTPIVNNKATKSGNARKLFILHDDSE